MSSVYHRLIDSRFGTYRGLIRLWLAQAEHFLGQLNTYRDVDLARVDRMVFVCLGNVCRSPYAELLAHEHGLLCSSFGLSTATGVPAYAEGITTAQGLGRDLTLHTSTDMADFEIRDTDLLLVMEVRQARALEKRMGNRQAQIALLGFWADPKRPHIHDPMTLSSDYFRNCYLTIESAVSNLAVDYRQHRKTSEARTA